MNTVAQRITGVILAKNEAGHIGACVDSLRPWVGRVVVLDSISTDRTREIAQAHGAFVIARPFDNYASQRQAALDCLDTDWILFLDADERMTDTLGQELHALLGAADATHSTLAGVWLPRRNFIAGKEVRGGGFYPDYQLRLLKRMNAQYVPEREVHEIVRVAGDESFATQPLLHFNYRDWPQFHRKQPAYARYEARILAARGIRPRPHNFILQPLREFRRRFYTLRGYQDGLHGLHLALWLAWYYGALPYYYLLTDADIAATR